MENQFSSKDELIRELNLLRQRNQELEKKASQLEANFNAFPDGITMLDRNAALDLMNTANILSQVFDSITDGVFALDIHWRFQFVNKQAAEYLGVLPEDLMGVNFFEKFPEFAGSILEEKFCFVKDTWQVEIFEMHDEYINDIWIQFRVYPSISGITVLCTDITERKNAETVLKETENRLNLALSAGKLGTWEVNLSTGKALWNEQAFKILGYEPGEVTPGWEGFRQRILPEDRETVQSHYQDSLQQGGAFFIDFRVLWLNGEVHWVTNRGYVEHDTNGRPTHCFGTAIDITERKKIEESLKESERFYRTIFDNSPDGFALIRICFNDQGKAVDHTIVKVNRIFETHAGLKAEDVVGKSFRDIEPRLDQYFPRNDSDLFEQAKTTNFEYYLHERNRWYDIYLFPFSESVYGIIFRGITERKKALEEIQRSEERFSRVFRFSPVVMALVTKNDSIFIDVNQAFEKTFGHTRESLIGKSAFEELNHIITNNETDRINTQLLKDKYINDHELLFRNAEGDLRIGC